jgi:hypothetical protein
MSKNGEFKINGRWVPLNLYINRNIYAQYKSFKPDAYYIIPPKL